MSTTKAARTGCHQRSERLGHPRVGNQINLSFESSTDSVVGSDSLRFYSLGTEMLDGKRYYAAFPDENPEIRPPMHGLLDALKKLEKEFRQHIEQFRNPALRGTTGQNSRNHRA